MDMDALLLYIVFLFMDFRVHEFHVKTPQHYRQFPGLIALFKANNYCTCSIKRRREGDKERLQRNSRSSCRHWNIQVESIWNTRSNSWSNFFASLSKGQSTLLHQTFLVAQPCFVSYAMESSNSSILPFPHGCKDHEMNDIYHLRVWQSFHTSWNGQPIDYL